MGSPLGSLLLHASNAVSVDQTLGSCSVFSFSGFIIQHLRFARGTTTRAVLMK